MTDILILGTGAMALLFGSRLISAGVKVSMLGTWKEGIKAIKEHGIRVAGDEDNSYSPAAVTSNINEIRKTRMVLVLVKSWQTERAARQLSNLLHPEGVVLTLQNGLGNLGILSDLLGKERTMQGVTTYGATLIGPGLVRPGGEGLITLGINPRLSPLKLVFDEAGFKVEESSDLSSLVWSKLVINVAINPLTALLGVPNGRLLESGAAKKIMSLAAKEAALVASEKGIPLIYKDPFRAAEGVAAATAGNISSMLQDIKRGSPTEIDVICGAIVREGKQLNIPTPVNQLFYQLIQSQVELFGQQ